MNISTLYPTPQQKILSFSQVIVCSIEDWFFFDQTTPNGGVVVTITSPTLDPIAKENQHRCRHGLKAPSKVDTILVADYQMMNSWSSFPVDLSAISWPIFRRILRQSHQSFDDFIKTWIRDTAGDTMEHVDKKGETNSRPYMVRWEWITSAKTESFKEWAVKSTVKITRSELQVLVKALGKFDPTANPEEPDLQGVIGSIKEHAQNTFQLLHSAS